MTTSELKINKKPLRFALPAILVILVLMLSAPVFLGYQKAAPGNVFLGITGLYPEEQFYYLSIGPSQAAKGSLMFADRYGRIPDEQVLLNPIGNAMALTARVTNFPLTVAYNIFRVLSSLFLILCFYYLARQFISSPFILILSVLLYSFSAGFDWWFKLLQISAIDPVDDSFPEANMFMAMSGEYYLPLANALFILTLTYAYKLFYKNENTLLQCGITLLALGATYIYGLIPAVIIIAIVAIRNGYIEKTFTRNILRLLKLAIFCLPVIGYYLWLIFQFSTIDDSGWFAPPSLASLLTTFGFCFFYSVAGLFFKKSVQLSKELYLLFWLITSILLIKIPQTILPIQVQMLIGLGAPLAILSATSLDLLGQAISAKLYSLKIQRKNLLAGVVVFSLVALSFTTNLKFYMQQFRDLEKQSLPLYTTIPMYSAMEWSAKNISDDNLVIISRNLGIFYSALTASKVYCGLDYGEKSPEQIIVERAINLISNNEVEKGKELFRETGANYLFFDKNLAQGDFEQIRNTLKVNFKECYGNREVSIFQLKP
jgi:hypothetical protein